MRSALSRLPPNLPDGRRYVVARFEDRGDRRAKVPYAPHDPQLRASVTDPQSWNTLESAVRVVRDKRADCVGLVLTGRDVVAIDLDGCGDRRTRTLTADAQRLIDALGSYSEWSPGDLGAHALVFGELPPGPRQRAGLGIYDRARFITLTGRRLPHTPRRIRPCPHLAALYRQLFPTVSPTGRAPRALKHAGNAVPDDALLRRAHTAANGEKFARLWAGDPAGYPSRSEADAALCAMLVFWTNHDLARVARLFQQSGLYRPARWQARAGGQTYGARTVAFAAAHSSSGYRPVSPLPSRVRPP